MRRILLVIVLCIFIAPTSAFALKCVEMPNVEEAYEIYDGVLLGQVMDVSANKEMNQVNIKVIKRFKGIEEDILSVHENLFWGSILAGPSEVGQEYLYFLRRIDSGWENALCSPTKKVTDASEELTYLQDKEIVLKTVPTATEPPSVNMTQVEAMVSDKGSKDDPPPSSTNWMVINVIGTGLLIVLGFVTLRLTRRGK